MSTGTLWEFLIFLIWVFYHAVKPVVTASLCACEECCRVSARQGPVLAQESLFMFLELHLFSLVRPHARRAADSIWCFALYLRDTSS